MKSSAGHESNAGPGPLWRALLRERPLVLDGAMGTELERRGADTGLPLWSAGALLSSPETVRRIHDEYIDAGADILTTDTFRTTRRTFLRAGLADRSAEMTSLAVALARESIAAHPEKHVLLAGSMAPLEDCYRPDLVPSDDALRSEHSENADRLAEAGVDFLLLETMGTVREALHASGAAKATGLEFAVSFLCKGEGSLYGGELLRDAVPRVAEAAPAVILLNCSAPGEMERNLRILLSALQGISSPGDIRVGAYANAGEDGPAAYAECAQSWLCAGASIAGGCCHTTPEYIRAIRRVIG